MRVNCDRETLARGPLCAVEVCVCGSVHVTIGALTMRVTPEAAAAITATLVEAMGQLSPRDAGDREAFRWVTGHATGNKRGVS